MGRETEPPVYSAEAYKRRAWNMIDANRPDTALVFAVLALMAAVQETTKRDGD